MKLSKRLRALALGTGFIVLGLLLPGCQGVEVCPELTLEKELISIDAAGNGIWAFRVNGQQVSTGIVGVGFGSSGCELLVEATAVGAFDDVGIATIAPGSIVQAICGNCPTTAIRVE